MIKVSTKPEQNIGLHRLTRITILLGNQLTKFRISYHTKFKVCPPHCIVVDRESLTLSLLDKNHIFCYFTLWLTPDYFTLWLTPDYFTLSNARRPGLSVHLSCHKYNPFLLKPAQITAFVILPSVQRQTIVLVKEELLAF